MHKIQTALITGASTGIGLSYCHALAKQKTNLVIIARNESALIDIKKELEAAYQIQVWVLSLDLSERNAAKDIQQFTQDKQLSIDCLINNAGYGDNGDFLALDWQESQKILQCMLMTLVELCHVYLPEMIKNQHGTLINVGSVVGLMRLKIKHRQARALYRPIKTFVVSFTQQLAKIYKDTGVIIQCLCPGLTYSNFHKRTGEAHLYNDIPKCVWMSADKVTAASLQAIINRKKTVVVTGFLNRCAIFLWKIKQLFQ